MAYETGSATDIEDLIDKLFTFATGLSTTPWTQDELDLSNNWGTLHRGTCFASFRWGLTSPTQLGVYSSLGFAGPGIAPHLHTDDSGNGSTVSTVTTERRVNFESSGPFTAYHFFAGEGSTPYIHIVVEVDTGRFRHFGFGNLVKLNDWTGGEYVYAHVVSQTSADIDNPSDTGHNVGLDHGFANAQAATIHAEGLPNQDGSSKWGVLIAGNAVPGNDTAANPRIRFQGTARAGGWGLYLAWMPTSQLNAYKPLIPIDVVYWDDTDTVDAWSWLGSQPDIAVINMKNLAVGDTISDGSDDWMVFPWLRKQQLLVNTEESWNAGWAYKVT